MITEQDDAEFRLDHWRLLDAVILADMLGGDTAEPWEALRTHAHRAEAAGRIVPNSADVVIAGAREIANNPQKERARI